MPISSSGHLAIIQSFYRLGSPIYFDILVHLGTLLAIIYLLRQEIYSLNRRTWLLVGVGSIPAGIVGVFLNDKIETIFSSLRAIGWFYLLGGAILLVSCFLRKGTRTLGLMKSSEAFFIGLFQALAILPGISRSGMTIIGGLWRGLSPEAAFNFSFLLAIPAILGALAMQLGKVGKDQMTVLPNILAFFISFVVGSIFLRVLKKVLIRRIFWVFGLYCLILGLILLV